MVWPRDVTPPGDPADRPSGEALLDVPTEFDKTSGEGAGSGGDERVYLVVQQRGTARVLDVPDGANVLFGRTQESAVHIDDTRASRRHAVLRRRGASLVLADLGSRNGTRINGDKLVGAEAPVAAGDVIRIGDVEAAVAVTEGIATAWERDSQPPPSGAAGGVVIADAAMAAVFEVAQRLGRVNTTVLILGETGVGKEVIAEHIHRASERVSGPFVRLNCAALPETLLESELFGHERGAFTGAERRKTGYFEAAHGGTLFLDEIGELPPVTQVKLLNVLENRNVRRLGATTDVTIDARVVAATHRDLDAEVEAGRFRQDLYYRLSAFTVRVPPLRERRVEIALLAEMFSRQFALRAGIGAPTISADAAAMLGRHDWPGNVRELRNAMERAVVLADHGVIEPGHLPAAVGAGASRTSRASSGAQSIDDRLADVERRALLDALEAEDGNQTRAAKRLGVSRSALIHRMRKHGLLK